MVAEDGTRVVVNNIFIYSVLLYNKLGGQSSTAGVDQRDIFMDSGPGSSF